MARYHGKNGKAVVGGSDKVNETSDWSMDLDAPMADASAQGNNSRNVLPGQYGGTVSISCSYDPSDTDGQEAMVTAFLAGTSVALTLYELPPVTGVKFWTVTAFVNKVGEKVPKDGKVSRDFSLTIDGDVTRSTVP